MTDEYMPSLDEALIEGMKIDARGRMRHDSRVWYEALESAIDVLLPPLIEAVRAEERERMTVDDLVATTAGLALANAAWQEGASTMLRSVNEHEDGRPGHRNPWSKPVSPYSAPLLARLNEPRESHVPMTVDTDPAADEYRETIAFLRENADALGIRAQGKGQGA